MYFRPVVVAPRLGCFEEGLASHGTARTLRVVYSTPVDTVTGASREAPHRPPSVRPSRWRHQSAICVGQAGLLQKASGVELSSLVLDEAACSRGGGEQLSCFAALRAVGRASRPNVVVRSAANPGRRRRGSVSSPCRARLPTFLLSRPTTHRPRMTSRRAVRKYEA